MKHFPIHKYAHTFLKMFGSVHSTECVYQFIGDDTEENINMFIFFGFLDWYYVLKENIMFLILSTYIP